ncbi:AMP-dependent synthetase/ligase [Pelovirga terrestris]|uniref:Long-chain fatty acid--CoA ligase n=1 Tax=Pelovirga terrestris TaxID=2771352 RepID=A0A8J6QU90_9BACT|nr:long-chain fatty acid--CoA ligase [Pelovirga terrestris]MBD1400025.1 long-chain fatty acid--CoA ligase [Pelovirga terrestris]
MPSTPHPNCPYQSLPQMLRRTAEQHADRPALSYKRSGSYITLNYQQFYLRVLMTARGLRKAGMQLGDNVVIFSENRIGWAIADFGIQTAGGASVPIYATNTGAQAAYIINHCAAKIVFVSGRQQYEKLLGVRDQLPQVELVVSFERFLGDLKLPVYTLNQLSEVSHPLTSDEKAQIEKNIESIAPDHLATVIYTSGTTGEPKGVMLSQYNLLINATIGHEHLGGINPDDIFLSFLPLSHVLERTAGYHSALLLGSHIAFAESVNTVLENIIEIKPTFIVSVPRLFEKIHSRIYESVHQSSSLKRQLFHRAVDIGREYVRRRYLDNQPVGLLGLKYRIYDKLVFSKIRAKFGGNLRSFICGGAPLDKTVNEFMWVIGLPVFEGYGLTETSPAVTLNNRRHLRFGSVGIPLEGTQLKLAEDGELLIKGPQVMQGYYKDDKTTAAAMDDGWFKSGDIATIDEQGFVTIVDRKKEIIITAAGKNIPPQPLENALKLDKYISQAFVYGDAKPYLVALLTPSLERLIELAQREKLDYLAVDELVTNRRVLELFKERVELFNQSQPSYQTIKKFALLPREFSIEGGELTPTMKQKRKEIYAIHKDQIDQLYLTNGGEK